MKKVIRKESPDFLMKIEYFSEEIKDKKTLNQEIIATSKVNSGNPKTQIENGKYLIKHKEIIKVKMLNEVIYLIGSLFTNPKNVNKFDEKLL